MCIIFSSCTSENIIEDRKQVDFSENLLDNLQALSCREVTVGLNVGIAYFETVITICCGYPIVGGALICAPVAMDGNEALDEIGFNLTSFLESKNIDEKITEIEIIFSNSVVLEYGEHLKIKSGHYEVNQDNYVNLEHEIK